MRERPILFSTPMVRAILAGSKTQTRRVCKGQRELSNIHDFRLDSCPYGQPGDRLWVREPWKANSTFNDNPPREIPIGAKVFYLADPGYSPDAARYRHARFMPRWASRILLELTDVRVQRLQDCSVEDALAEGVTHHTLNDPRVEYQWLWDSINGTGAWAANPWVWAIEFKRSA